MNRIQLFETIEKRDHGPVFMNLDVPMQHEEEESTEENYKEKKERY